MDEPATSFPEYPPTAAELIHAAVAKHGDRTLVILGDERTTFAVVEARSAQLARGLLASGVGKGTRVGLLAPNGPEWIVGWLAAARIGAVVVLLNTYHQTRELSWTLRHADVQHLLTVDRYLGHDYLDRLEGVAPEVAAQPAEQIFVTSHPFLRSVWVWGAADRPWAGTIDDLAARGDRVSEELLRQVESEVSPADPIVVVYSSGSTTDPKGAIHSQGAVVRHAHNLWQFRDITAEDIVYTPMPLFWVGGLSFTLIAALHAGCTLVFEEQFEPGRTLELLERERVTQVLGWPHMSNALTEHPTFPERDLSSIRGGTLVGLLPAAEQEAALRKPNALGMTETIGPHTFGDSAVPLPDEKLGSFGLSVPGVEHRVVDPATGEDLPPGELGELWIRGYSLMLGLHKQERDQVFTADGWYRSGDGGYFDADGHFFFKGRLGDQIKSSGMNITPREVELVLESFPEVMTAFVSGIPHPERGEDVVAAVVLRPGEDVDGDALRARVKAEIASYKVPRHLAVFKSELELPWLDSGKIDRRQLTAMLNDRFGKRD
jgi:acyl-CoA synthetase (AMP-forming)/AMP-acid ligase II